MHIARLHLHTQTTMRHCRHAHAPKTATCAHTDRAPMRASRPHIPIAHSGRVGRPMQSCAHTGRVCACRPRMCIPAAHAGRVHQPVCSLAHTGHVRRYRLRILADTPTRSHRPVCPWAHTKVVYPGIPADVHMTHTHLATPILLLIYNIHTSVSP